MGSSREPMLGEHVHLCKKQPKRTDFRIQEGTYNHPALCLTQERTPTGIISFKGNVPNRKAISQLINFDQILRLESCWLLKAQPGNKTTYRYLANLFKNKYKALKNKRFRVTQNDAQVIQAKPTVTYTPGHKIGKSPIIFFMEEQMTNTTTE